MSAWTVSAGYQKVFIAVEECIALWRENSPLSYTAPRTVCPPAVGTDATFLPPIGKRSNSCSMNMLQNARARRLDVRTGIIGFDLVS